MPAAPADELTPIARLTAGTRALAGEAAAALAHAAVAQLRALDAPARVDLAREAQLPASLVRLGADAAPLCAFLVEDEALRRALGADTIEQWLGVDTARALSVGLAYLDEWPARTAVALLRHLDAEEAWELAAARYARDGALRRHIALRCPAHAKHARAVDVARAALGTDPVEACALLGLNGSAAAVDELIGVIERAQELELGVVAALDALQRCLGWSRAHVALAVLLRKPFAETLVGSPLAPRVSAAAQTLRRELSGNIRALEIIDACVRAHPFRTAVVG